MAKSRARRQRGPGRKLGKEVTRAFDASGAYPAPQNYVPANQIFKVTQSVPLTGFTTSTTLSVFTAYLFRFSDVDQTASLAVVFDQYRIDEVEVWIIPRFTENVSESINPGLLYSAVDYDDATAVSTIGAMQDYTNVLQTGGTSGHYRRFKPHIAVAAYNGSFGGFANAASQWIDAASNTVQHYGLKVGVTATTAAQVYDVQARYHMSFRNVR